MTSKNQPKRGQKLSATTGVLSADPNFSVPEWQQDFSWSSIYDDQAHQLIADNYPKIWSAVLPHKFSVHNANKYLDTQEATDIVIDSRLQVALRVRRSDVRYRDWTIRAARANNAKTELEKLLEGYGDIYFYGWIKKDKTIQDYLIIDLHKARSCGILHTGKYIINKNEQTSFVAIGYQAVAEWGCLVAGEIGGNKWDGEKWG